MAAHYWRHVPGGKRLDAALELARNCSGYEMVFERKVVSSAVCGRRRTTGHLPSALEDCSVHLLTKNLRNLLPNRLNYYRFQDLACSLLEEIPYCLSSIRKHFVADKEVPLAQKPDP